MQLAILLTNIQIGDITQTDEQRLFEDDSFLLLNLCLQLTTEEIFWIVVEADCGPQKMLGCEQSFYDSCTCSQSLQMQRWRTGSIWHCLSSAHASYAIKDAKCRQKSGNIHQMKLRTGKFGFPSQQLSVCLFCIETKRCVSDAWIKHIHGLIKNLKNKYKPGNLSLQEIS